ncbi:hypothetical protein FDP41_007390 [Naegleria fowleri]|uniref:Cytochrome b5 heme-binding domain-containing protein n=1 Tax=Naegleria fowleri TaxID=5763 RepID=A0A6A5C191_NAEFO|nr:uncharacterized protein FDP41_007390 [Naegleria fowleri]KAF0984213.1 hypothetical protein FDP41_007390 [Naegleria fowleri]CAG4708582.1 unnamed protein product [Naegleria fowleri]
MSTTRTITKQELEEHNEDNTKAQWIAVDGKVYDITDYKHEHPGGEDILLEHAGADATEAFENVGHSKDARNRLKSLLVGELAGYKSSSTDEEATSSSSGKEAASSDSSMVKILLAVGVVVVLGGIYFTKIAQ